MHVVYLSGRSPEFPGRVIQSLLVPAEGTHVPRVNLGFEGGRAGPVLPDLGPGPHGGGPGAVLPLEVGRGVAQVGWAEGGGPRVAVPGLVGSIAPASQPAARQALAISTIASCIEIQKPKFRSTQSLRPLKRMSINASLAYFFGL